MTGNRRSFQALRDPWMLLLVGAALFFGLRTFTDGASTPSPSNEYRVAAKNIEDFRCGDRMLGRNPLRHEVDDFPDPTPQSHRLLTLRMRKGDTSTLHIRLLRTLEWIELAEASVGRTVDLYLPEMGAVGPAEILEITPCPPIEDGPGNVVTGTFRHDADDVILLQLEGDVEPIGCTSNHRFWSEDRRDFVEAGELKPQERLRTRLAGIVRVASSTRKPGAHTVYNVEIHGEHVYEVSSVGTLVHNSYAKKPVLLGEYMPRVRAAASPNGFRVWPARNWDAWEAAGVTVQKNMRWLRDQIRGGKEIYSLGKTPGFPRGDYYREEVTLLLKKGYRRRFVRMIDVPGFGRVRLYKWVHGG